MNVLSLFSGIGGLDLGLQRAGMTIAGQVEIDPWCRKVLAKHWPEVPRHDDVRTCAQWWGGRPVPDLICGGFPCQPFSSAGLRRGTADERWLWPAFADTIRRLRPRFVLMENVARLLDAALGNVLGDLAACGYDAEWDCIPAEAVGAPHERDRVWIVAYPNPHSGRCQVSTQLNGHAAQDPPNGHSRWRHTDGLRDEVADAYREPLVRAPITRAERHPWPAEPAVGRVAHGIPRRVDRLRGLGNAVVPQVAEHIGRLIMEAAA